MLSKQMIHTRKQNRPLLQTCSQHKTLHDPSHISHNQVYRSSLEAYKSTLLFTPLNIIGCVPLQHVSAVHAKV